ncbi:MAG: hypothetical protein J5803_00765, partial [Desulfovibrio sp.]|nr:hypothetical protein [Desulfovibrio sp.]
MMQETSRPFAETSYSQGSKQDFSRERFFNEREYYCFKAVSFYQQSSNGGYSEQEIRAHLPRFARSIAESIEKAGLTAWQHYTQYGTKEGINPSNDFSTVAYLKAKAKALNRAGILNNGLPWDWESVGEALQQANMNALQHFLRYAGKGPKEAPFGLTSSGTIPAQYSVPEAERVPSFAGEEGTTYTMTRKESVSDKSPTQAKPASKGQKRVPKRDPKDFFLVGEYLQFKALE